MWTDDNLVEETEWSRTYANHDRSRFYYESKFLDSEASIALGELTTWWPAWSENQRHEFCMAISCAPPDNMAELLGVLITDETDLIRSMIAFCVAKCLPAEQSVPLLSRWVEEVPPGDRANYIQAIGGTHHPDAHRLLQHQFEVLSQHPQLMDDAGRRNDIAMDLVTCIESLLQIDTPVDPLQPAYLKLSQHPCTRVREAVDRWLTESFTDDSGQTDP